MAIPHAQSGEIVDITPLGPTLAATKTAALIKSSTLEVIRLVIPAGKDVAEHTAPGDITVQCLEGEVDFTMADIDALSRRVPCLSKVAPAKSDVHMEDVHRAGGIMSILGELDKGGLLNRDCPTVHAETLGDAIDRWDITRTNSETVRKFYRAAPGGIPTQVAFSQEARWDELDTDRVGGVIRSVEHPFSKDGGLAVLKGNLAVDGCIVRAPMNARATWFSRPIAARPSGCGCVAPHVCCGAAPPGPVLRVRAPGYPQRTRGPSMVRGLQPPIGAREP